MKQFGVREGERVTLDNSDAMAKLCLWQLVLGYNLRGLEARDQLARALDASDGSSDGSGDGSSDGDSDTAIDRSPPPPIAG